VGARDKVKERAFKNNILFQKRIKIKLGLGIGIGEWY
jgi:hypothetical protein